MSILPLGAGRSTTAEYLERKAGEAGQEAVERAISLATKVVDLLALATSTTRAVITKGFKALVDKDTVDNIIFNSNGGLGTVANDVYRIFKGEDKIDQSNEDIHAYPDFRQPGIPVPVGGTVNIER